MLNRKGPGRDLLAAEMPRFAMQQGHSGWQVRITWPDGEQGPSIDFMTRNDAEIWIARDAVDWLARLRALDKSAD